MKKKSIYWFLLLVLISIGFIITGIWTYEKIYIDKEIQSYIANGELVIDKIFRLKEDTGNWPSKGNVFYKETDFYSWRYSYIKKSFIISGLFTSMFSKYIIKYIYNPPLQKGWYIENYVKNKPEFLQKSETAEKWIGRSHPVQKLKSKN